ncbi:MAG: hypothetical protein ACI8QS_003025 [Planctomycetota bacterium]|jgi:uncharacterized protein (TIGR01777 family)
MKSTEERVNPAVAAGLHRRKIVIPGGSGRLGRILAGAFRERGDEVVVLTRRPVSERAVESRREDLLPIREVHWDGRSRGSWEGEIDGADAVLNLAGRCVDCRYNKHNLEQMLHSRVDSTRAVGRAIERSIRPPGLWLQMSTATIYAHRMDAPNDEATGVIGGFESGVPGYWRTSVNIALEWERAQAEAHVPGTRRIALRSAMVMSSQPGGAFLIFKRLARLRLGGSIAGGRAFMSWIHERDFVRAIQFLMEHRELEGAINLAAPEPLPQAEFMAALRDSMGIRIGLPATRAMVHLGASILGSDPELILKSRRVIPGTLLAAGFAFDFPSWGQAARDLVA